ncbi:MAG: leucine-rich repeat protein [Eubacterium sp.]|nr:leucine-rich repeat protein [Eubacterium sp.]
MVLSKALQTIDSYTFYGCEKLKTITIPEGVTAIYERAFENCTSLVEIDLPDTLTHINNRVFRNCDSLENIVIPEKTDTIGYEAFYDCDSLKTVVLPDSLGSIESSTFYSCDSLESVDLGNGIKNIAYDAFRLCPALTEIVLPKSLEKIGTNAFAECTKLTKVTIYPNTTEIPNNAFSYPARTTVYGYKGTYADEYANSRGMTFVPLDKITADKITFDISEQEYTGKQIKPDVILTDDGYKLKKGVDYAIMSYGNNTEVGKGTVKINLIGAMYEGAIEAVFEIVPANIANANCYSDGSVYYNGSYLEEGKDYTVSYRYNLDSEGYDVVFNGIGNFTGTATVTGEDAKPLLSYRTGWEDEDALNMNWDLDFSLADDDVWHSVDRVEAVVYTNGSISAGLGAQTVNSDWVQVYNKSVYGYQTIVIDDMGGLKTGVDENGENQAVLNFGLWWMDSYTSASLISVTLYDKNGNVIMEFPQSENFLIYELNDDGTANIIDADVIGSEIVIPDEINGHEITSIADNAFADNAGLTDITIPGSVDSIGDNAFAGCSDELTIHGYIGSYVEEYAAENNINFAPIVDIVDKNTGIGISDPDNSVPDDAVLVVEETETNDKRAVYEITLIDSYGDAVQPDGEVTVLILIPEAWKTAEEIYVYYRDESGNLTDMNAYIYGDYIVFNTTHFSEYVVSVEEQTEFDVLIGDVNGDGVIDPLDNIALAMWLAGWDGEINEAAADINGDGTIDPLDNIALAMQLAGW